MNLSRCLPALHLSLALTVTQAAHAASINLVHAAGQTSLPAPARKVVALGPHALDMLLSLGVQPVGYGEAAQLSVNNFGSPIRQIRYLGSRVQSSPVNVGDRFKPNLEVIASLKPDLIVGENYAQETYPALNRLAPTVLFEGIHAGDWQKSLPVLARALGREKQAQAVLARHQQLMQQARQQLPQWTRGKRALVVWNAGGASRDLFTVLGPRDWTGGFFRDLGWTLDLPGQADTSLSEGYAKLSSEGLSTSKADVIFVIAASKNTVQQARKDWQANALAQRLKASRDGHVYFLDVQLFSRIRGPIAEELMLRELLRQLGGTADR